MSKKTCLECGDTFAGRVDKKFCSDGCRNTYNNKINKDSKNLIRNTTTGCAKLSNFGSIKPNTEDKNFKSKID